MKLPSALPKNVWAPACVLLLLAGVLSSVLQTKVPVGHTASSYGVMPFGWGAAFDLLTELQLGATRTRDKFARRPSNSSQWLVQPAWSEHELAYELSAVQQFVQAGGTVLLIGADSSVWKELGVAAVVSEQPPGDDAPAPDAGQDKLDKTEALLALPEASQLTGRWLRRARSVELSPLTLFTSTEPSGYQSSVHANAGAFVLERTLGSGRLVLVAGADFLTNERLGNADNAPFLVDLVREYGAPTFDERCHGFTRDSSPWVALGPGFLWLLCVTLLAATSASLLWARRWPLPGDGEHRLPPPTLEVFVSSLASLYRARGRRDPRAVFRAYRAGYMRRLQRLLFGQREVSQAHFDARVQREAMQRGPAGRWLREDAQPGSAQELSQAVSALEKCAFDLRARGQVRASTTHRKRQA